MNSLERRGLVLLLEELLPLAQRRTVLMNDNSSCAGCGARWPEVNHALGCHAVALVAQTQEAIDLLKRNR